MAELPSNSRSCFDDNEVAELAQGVMDPTLRAAALSHLDVCDDCRARLSALAASLASNPAAADHISAAAEPSSAAPRSPPAPGTPMGRYLLLSTLGQGGMGVVHAAYDPALDRKIALKLIRPELIGSTQGPELRERLLREAQAMARLSHPNVAAVYDMGEIDAHVFVAMEFVEGETLRTWLECERRSPRDVVGVFIAAGRGLAAAHAMGIVHRDFKPENVLCGPAGRIAVTDFGLAQWVAPDDDASDGAMVDEPGESRRMGVTRSAGGQGDRPLLIDGAPPADAGTGDARSRGVAGAAEGGAKRPAGTLTRTGMLLGTPAYMAPEQRRLRIADARSDQYAFAVSLYEGLYRRRPWSDGTAGDAGESLPSRGAPAAELPDVAFPASPAVPNRLRRALRTALAADPAHRFADMESLLRELSASLRSRRPLAIGAVVAVLGIASVSLNITRSLDTRPTPLQACLAGRDAAQAIWNPAAAAQLAAGLRGAARPSARPLADTTAAAVHQRLTGFFAGWSSAYTTACTASWQDGAQSPSALDARLSCLELTRDSAAHLIARLAAADAVTLEKAVELTGALDARDCLTARPDPQRMALAPAALVEVRRLERAVADAEVQTGLGHYAEARAALTALWWQAEPIGLHRLLADILHHRSLAEDLLGRVADAEASARAAVWHASAGDAPELELMACAQLAYIVGHHAQRFAEAELLLPRATAVLARLGGAPRLELAILRSSAAIASRRARYDEALATLERASALARQVHGAASPTEATLRNAAGNNLEHLGRYPEAAARYQQALAIQRDTLGEHHPALAATYQNLAIIAMIEKRFDESRAHLRTALDLVTRALGNEVPLIASLQEEMALSYQAEGNDAEALRYHLQAIALAERTLPPEHTDLAGYRSNLALVYKHLRRFDEARRLLDDVLALETRVFGAEDPRRATTLLGIAQVLHESGKLTQALPYAREARGIYERTLGKAHPDTLAGIETETEIARALARRR